MKDPILTKSREVKTCPPHFIKVRVATIHGSVFSVFSAAASSNDDGIESTVERRARNWLHENIEHRFYIGKHTKPYEQGLSVESLVAAFEDPADATYFSLFLPNLFK